MITFKEFLAESKSAPLYHGTAAVYAYKILDTNKLIGDIQYHGKTASLNKPIIFLTRSKKQASHFIGFKSNNPSVVFQIDQQKLSYNYKIRPIKNHAGSHKPMYMTKGMGSNEFEEIVDAKEIKNFLNYVTKIYVNDNNIKEYMLSKFKDLNPDLIVVE